ncbi:MAG: TRAP-type transport system small permease protein [Petroclostridium sp.]|uniref:TRAP transporter small permease n=1 Tax=Petroclostridium xylanilyticum TaxID=1792311 RepID=UPI000B99B08D|nr:TRAP transporter small permease [Petroclostridium xylanilyticum]MBZ4645290.1 transporter small permease [Clostridia bacterium]MDK2809496.1 TRAP-type transport system small permease protein [Petroclostridium sp.]
MSKSKVIKFVEGFCLFIFVMLVSLVILQVFFRYVAKTSVPWTEEIARVLYIWLVFIGVAIVEAENAQIRTTYLLEKLPLKVRYVLEVIINILSIVFLIIFFVGSIKMLRESWIYMLGSIPWMSGGVIYIPAVIGAPLAAWYLIKQVINFNKNIDSGERRGEG